MGKALLENELIIAVDFDGTITKEPDISETMTIRENCADVLLNLKRNGVRLVLWTCRTGESLDSAVKFLWANGIGHIWDCINDQLPEVNAKYAPNVARKVGADLYIDDKAYMAEIDWEKIEQYIYYGR